MPIIFKAKTHEAYYIKVLAELLQNNIKPAACFEIDKNGIHLCMMDNNRSILIKVELDANNFSLYKFKQEKMFLGINLNHFHKMLKSIKKKDSLQLFIDSDSPTDLGIEVIPKENNRITTSYIKIQSIQNIDTDIPEGYGRPVKISSSEYQKMCKDMSHIGNNVRVVSKRFYIKFKCDASGVMRREVSFGENDDSDDDTSNEEYNHSFETTQLTKITKISGLGSNILVYPKDNLPLLFRSSVGDLGTIAIYIKSKTQMELEKQIVESDEE